MVQAEASRLRPAGRGSPASSRRQFHVRASCGRRECGAGGGLYRSLIQAPQRSRPGNGAVSDRAGAEVLCSHAGDGVVTLREQLAERLEQIMRQSVRSGSFKEYPGGGWNIQHQDKVFEVLAAEVERQMEYARREC